MRGIKAIITTVGESDPRPSTYLARLFHKPRYNELVDIIRRFIGKTDILLDIGCGKGILYEWLVKSGLEIKTYVGCDINLKHLKEAKSEKVICDAHFLPFREKAADCVVCSEVLEHLKQPLLAFNNILKVSGKWVIITFPDEKIKNALGFKYPEHISSIKLEELIKLSGSLSYFLVYHKKLYFAFPPSTFDKIMSFSQTRARLASIFLQILSKMLGELCLIKTEILIFIHINSLKRL